MTESIDNFVFSVDIGKKSKRDLELRISALQERVDKIVSHVIIADMPIVSGILNLTSDPDDLRLIAKALDRLADIVPELQKLKSQYSLIKASIDNPHWVAATFADFSLDVERLTEMES